MTTLKVILAVLLSGAVTGSVDDFCGFAPLCGDGDQEFDWQTEVLSDGLAGNFVQGAELTMTDCCKLGDTVPVEDCQIVDPSGESYRTLSSSRELCGVLGEDCEDIECSELQLVIKPQFARDSSNAQCCDSCTCYGDPQCISFSGEERMWALCDGREVPREESIWEMCRITRNQCSQEIDHAGNQCQYLAEDKRGRDWVVGKQGSPCRPHPDSPPSIITMYESEEANFKLSLEQGDRGIIKKVILDLECGSFELSAEDCVEQGEDAWSHTTSELPPFFSYNDVVHGFDEHWSIIDPDSSISISLRCYANRFAGDDTSYVPRINIEDLSDPLPRESNSGFCVSGEFDFGSATTENTDFIASKNRCDEGLQDSNKRDIYRAMCKNPSLPSSAHDSCIYHFCNKHYLPMFESVERCEQEFESSLANGFCKGITYSERDTDKCVEQWFDLGAVETIQQYYNDQSGCSTTLLTSLDKCQSGIIVQFFRNNQWNDEIAIPSDYCGDEEIVLSYCDHKYLFNRNIRILQKSANIACGPVNQCSQIDGFIGTFEMVRVTPSSSSPTEFPSTNPTTEPTSFPTPFPVTPTAFPTSFPSALAGNSPTVCPEEPLCSTDNENIAYDDNRADFQMEECCVSVESVCDSEQSRTQTAPEWYCGLSDGADGSVEDSIAGIECEDENELQISVMFSHDEECCQKCTCFGDPRCFSFDGSFDEFVLCDGRTPGEDDDDRCIIRKETCEEQTDHAGNNCAWTNPIQTPPDLDDALAQAQAEREYSVVQYGSPCRYDENISPTSTLLMYETLDPYRVEIENGERGYIQAVHLTTDSGEFKITSDSCLAGENWEVMDGSTFDMTFSRSTFGLEYLWTVEDKATKILLKIRCTGHLFESKFTTSFINVEAILDWDERRIRDGSGFCSSNSIPEKALASTEYSDLLKSEGKCTNWNAGSTDILKREVARVITNNPGVTKIGTEVAYQEFCTTFYAPTWRSVTDCVNAFLDAESVKETMEVFCDAVTREVDPCVENLEVIAEEAGYKEAFREGYETFVVNFEKQCEVKFSDLPETLSFDEDTCQTGVELQFFNPRKDKWVTYAAFPANDGYCTGYKVSVIYDFHPKLFKNPLRFIQKHDTSHCNQCTQVSSVQAFLQFNTEAEE